MCVVGEGAQRCAVTRENDLGVRRGAPGQRRWQELVGDQERGKHGGER